MIACPKCKKTVQVDARYCTNCGTKIKIITDKNFIIALIIVLFAFSFSPLIIKYGFNKPKKLTKSEVEVFVETLKSKEVLKKIDIKKNKAYVSSLVWSLFVNNKKEEISRNLADYCAYNKGPDQNFISILDIRTNQVLATYDKKGKYKSFK